MKPRLTYANVVSTLALFIALTGASAYAANQIADKSVGEPQLRPGAVTADKIRKNAVTAPKIKASAIKQGKIADGSITAAKMTLNSVTSGSIAASSVTGEKIAPDAVTGDKVVESTLSQVPSASKADFATAAESANPIAFAHVNKDATLDTNLSKGISSASDGNLAGIYCVGVSGFVPRGAQVTPQFEVGGNVNALVKIGGTASCPAPLVEVQTFEGAARTREPFYVAFYR
ncbi:MAG TPA: hypothetical protein VGN84_11980 [Solirubrobacterales bacterium]|jgi:hypothetical protein|nr:hypothetical protein [Solirubrobacterales bacterium]